MGVLMLALRPGSAYDFGVNGTWRSKISDKKAAAGKGLTDFKGSFDGKLVAWPGLSVA